MLKAQFLCSAVHQSPIFEYYVTTPHSLFLKYKTCGWHWKHANVAGHMYVHNVTSTLFSSWMENCKPPLPNKVSRSESILGTTMNIVQPQRFMFRVAPYCSHCCSKALIDDTDTSKSRPGSTWRLYWLSWR